MSHRLPIEQAAAKLAELVGMLQPGDEIVLTAANRPVARIVPSKENHPLRRPGSCKGMLIVHKEDEGHLRDFRKYMP